MFLLVVLTFYLGWILLTCMNQHSFMSDTWVQKYDIFHLVPIWTFFAPNPGVSDYNLLFRVKKADGSISGFQEVPLRSEKKIAMALFNPNRRLQKALHDHARAIIMNVDDCITEQTKANIKLTFSYISILNFCSKLARKPDAYAVQFMIIETFGYNELTEPRLILNSEFHRI
jgi:hypothetical protein